MALIEMALIAAAYLQAVPPVPGGCSAPAGENRGKAGCFLSAELPILQPAPQLYWHIVQGESEAAAAKAARRFRHTAIVNAHNRWWLYVMSRNAAESTLPRHHVVGPFDVAAGKPIAARFMESWFSPGMRTRVHSHSGPEAFYIMKVSNAPKLHASAG